MFLKTCKTPTATVYIFLSKYFVQMRKCLYQVRYRTVVFQSALINNNSYMGIHVWMKNIRGNMYAYCYKIYQSTHINDVLFKHDIRRLTQQEYQIIIKVKFTGFNILISNLKCYHSQNIYITYVQSVQLNLLYSSTRVPITFFCV